MEAAKTENEHENEREPVKGEVLEDGTVVVAESGKGSRGETTAPKSEEPGTPQPPPEVAPGEAEEEHEATEVAEPEPEPEQGYSEDELEAMRARLDKEDTRHANRVSEIMGDVANTLVPCELCGDPTTGFHWPAEIVPPSDDLRGRLLAVLRNPPEPGLRESPHTETCRDCDGWGKVLSGSRVADNKRIVCPTCKGNGYTVKGDATAPDLLDNVIRPTIVPAPDVDAPLPDADVWGSPRLLPDGQENPNFGKMPNYKNAELP